MFFKIGVLNKFRNIHSKTPVLESLINKVIDLKTCNFIQKRHKCFPMNNGNALRTKNLYKTFPLGAYVAH